MTNLLMASKLFNGLFVFILGIVVVFFGITVIVIVIEGIGKIMSAKKKKAEPGTEVNVSEDLSDEISNELSDETVAVITAALTAYYFKQNSNCEFKIKKIKRIL